jgi:uncharacterized membrane protein
MEATVSEHKPKDYLKLDPLRHHAHYQDAESGSAYAGGSSFMERMSEKVASGMGTVPFLIVSAILILGWVFANGAVHYIHATVHAVEQRTQFDPEPWILLNLIFSAVAFSRTRWSSSPNCNRTPT